MNSKVIITKRPTHISQLYLSDSAIALFDRLARANGCTRAEMISALALDGAIRELLQALIDEQSETVGSA